jgi:hypothetical protein
MRDEIFPDPTGSCDRRAIPLIFAPLVCLAARGLAVAGGPPAGLSMAKEKLLGEGRITHDSSKPVPPPGGATQTLSSHTR